MAGKKIKEMTLKNKVPVRPQKNWAKALSKEELIKLIREGQTLSKCKFKLVLLQGIDSKGQYQSRDRWAALMNIETKDLSLLKKISKSNFFLLMIREGVCHTAIQNFKDKFKEIQVCLDLSEFSDFLNVNKKIVLDELLRLSKKHSNFVPLVQACKYIKKQLNKEIRNYDEFLYLGKMMDEPYQKNNDINNK